MCAIITTMNTITTACVKCVCVLCVSLCVYAYVCVCVSLCVCESFCVPVYVCVLFVVAFVWWCLCGGGVVVFLSLCGGVFLEEITQKSVDNIGVKRYLI